MIRTLSVIITATALCACSSSAPTKPAETTASADPSGAGGIVYGKDWSFVATAPKGWYMSLRSGLPVKAAFFQETPSDSGRPPTFMYITLSRPAPGLETLDQLIAQDEADFKARSPDLKVTAQPDVLMGDKKPAQVHRFENTQSGRTELVAYRAYGTDMYKFVVSAPSSESLTMNAPAFEALLANFVTATIQFK